MSRCVSHDEILARLEAGGIVAVPTDTVYGLVCSMDSTVAIERIYDLKGRNKIKALIALVSSIDMARSVVEEWPEQADRLARAYWPGALTIVLPKGKRVSESMCSGVGTVGVRVPAHEELCEIIDRVGPLASTSANRSGNASPTEAAHVLEQFEGVDVCVLDGGPCDGGVPSTVVEIIEGDAMVHRAGAIDPETIDQLLEV
ncbi:MAG: L-threonylcarbamoyladenylate synthase [Phycisphaerales bacterium JB043]